MNKLDQLPASSRYRRARCVVCGAPVYSFWRSRNWTRWEHAVEPVYPPHAAEPAEPVEEEST